MSEIDNKQKNDLIAGSGNPQSSTSKGRNPQSKDPQSVIRNPLVIALDVDSADQALFLVERLRGVAGMFKVGKQLFTAAGPEVVRKIIAAGERVFLDLKFHDIPNTVAMAGVEAARLGVSVFNVHALGGSKMMRAVNDAVTETAERERIARPLILGVTVLTSHSQDSLKEVGIDRTLEDEVVNLARLCSASGLDGVVASPLEIAPIRSAIEDSSFVILTPGVRPAGASLNDQSRVMTPADAVRAGANFLVIGRPITAANDPVAAAREILEEINIDQVGIH
ncbi:MAG TPA: orotidine-5'-phosphate decarboxylase [Blastocatellia bacterium]|jgi:orotidine-5'-phosphate decarboxylase|nr:orotidine-5'-phosphate decarboxylase [Blastocatellia bacterium]